MFPRFRIKYYKQKLRRVILNCLYSLLLILLTFVKQTCRPTKSTLINVRYVKPNYNTKLTTTARKYKCPKSKMAIYGINTVQSAKFWQTCPNISVQCSQLNNEKMLKVMKADCCNQSYFSFHFAYAKQTHTMHQHQAREPYVYVS